MDRNGTLTLVTSNFIRHRTLADLVHFSHFSGLYGLGCL